MDYEELSLSGFVKEMKEASNGPHSRKFCFVLGAGASRSSGEPAKPSIGYVMLGYILTHTKHHVVITTNFDHLIEDTVNYYEHTIPLVIEHESLAHYVTKQINRPMIIKIHRELLPDSGNAASEVDKLHDNWKKALNIVFSEYHPVFVGYAGNDNSLMDFLIENREKVLKKDWMLPYWMLYRTDEMNEKVKIFLNETNGYLIFHSGFDDVFCMLGVAFEYKLPSKEEFLSDDERRYQMLTDSIDAYTKESIDKGEAVSGKMRKAIGMKPEKADWHFQYGKALSEAGEYEKGLEEIRKAVELNPDNAAYRCRLGIVLGGLERYEESVMEIRKAIELEPENAKYHFGAGILYEGLECYEEALEAIREAVKLEPENAEYHYGAGRVLHAMGRCEEALEEMRKAMELEPGNAAYHEAMGNQLLILKRCDEALIEARKAVELEPENAALHVGLGIVLAGLDRRKEAEREIRNAIRLKPDNAAYHAHLGIILHFMGRKEEAKKEMRRAIKLEPENENYEVWFEELWHTRP